MFKTRIINLTPHDLNIFSNSSELVQTIKSSGIVTVKTERTPSKLKRINIPAPIKVPIVKEVIGLPDETEGVLLFVSTMVRKELPHRKDLISPSSNRDDIVRDEKGMILGLKEFDANY